MDDRFNIFNFKWKINIIFKYLKAFDESSGWGGILTFSFVPRVLQIHPVEVFQELFRRFISVINDSIIAASHRRDGNIKKFCEIVENKKFVKKKKKNENVSFRLDGCRHTKPSYNFTIKARLHSEWQKNVDVTITKYNNSTYFLFTLTYNHRNHTLKKSIDFPLHYHQN